jgi:HSP20 family protein
MSERDLGGFEKLLRGLGGLFDQMADLTRTLQSKRGEPGAAPVVEHGVRIRTAAGEEIDRSFFGLAKEAPPEGEAGEAREEAPPRRREAELRQPPIELIEEAERVVALVEMPGAEEETLDITLDGDLLTVRAGGATVEYRSEAVLPVPVEPASQRLSFRNGVLELSWRRPKASGGSH